MRHISAPPEYTDLRDICPICGDPDPGRDKHSCSRCRRSAICKDCTVRICPQRDMPKEQSEEFKGLEVLHTVDLKTGGRACLMCAYPAEVKSQFIDNRRVADRMWFVAHTAWTEVSHKDARLWRCAFARQAAGRIDPTPFMSEYFKEVQE